MADRRILELEASRDLSRIWLHVDMDAFYAAVETLSNPTLKGKPMAVGGMSMISTANYEVIISILYKLDVVSEYFRITNLNASMDVQKNNLHKLCIVEFLILFFCLYRPGNLEFVLPCLGSLHASYVQN